MDHTALNLHSADVNALFPSISLPHTTSLLQDVFTTITPSSAQCQWLSSLSDLIVNNNYFSFDQQFFCQSAGAPMGSPLSSTLAEVVMQNLEATILPYFHEFFTIFWFWYVDDIFILTDASFQSVQTILDRMTNNTPQITFTLQPETDGQLAFLDVLITREDSRFHTQVYHKPTANTSIIPATSMSARSHKLAAFRSFFTRALTIPSKPKYIHKEVKHIFSVAEQHGFPKVQISRLWRLVQNQPHTQLIPDHSLIFLGSLSYMSGTSERLTRWLHRKGYRIACSPNPNIFQSVRSDKPPPPPPFMQAGVYCIPILLPDGQSTSYIGSTIRCLQQRITEHQKACRDRNVYSVLAQATMAGGQLIWNQAAIIGHARNTSLLRWKEAVCIHANRPINRPSLLLDSMIL